MDEKDKQNGFSRNSLPRSTAIDLLGKQSVRATFKLTADCINAISIVARHLQIKQKSLFDHLVEDVRILQSIAGSILQSNITSRDRVQKTYVISRKSLCTLENVSKKYDTPRDVLVEHSVQRLLPLIISEQKKHEKRKKILSEISAHLKSGRELLEKINTELELEDPLLNKFNLVMGIYENTYDDIYTYIKKGTEIEDFNPRWVVS